MIEQIEKWIFPVSVALLIIVEITLIVTLIKLKQEIKKLNGNMNEYFGKMMDKIKGLVDLFLKAQLSKFGSGELKIDGEKFSADVKLEKK